MILAQSGALPELNRVAISASLAVLFCPTANGKMFGVTVDREDLQRVQAEGFWRVGDFNSPKGLLYCYKKSHGNRLLFLHRLLLSAPPNIHVDHKNNRSLDNRKSELRFADHSLNQFNRKNTPKGEDRGVRAMPSGRFQAIYWKRKNRKSLGTFDTREAARAAVRQFLDHKKSETAKAGGQ